MNRTKILGIVAIILILGATFFFASMGADMIQQGTGSRWKGDVAYYFMHIAPIVLGVGLSLVVYKFSF